MYFVKKQDRIVAKMLVVRTENGYSSRFDTSVGIIDEFYHKNIPFALTVLEDDIFVAYDGGLVSMGENDHRRGERLGPGGEYTALTFWKELVSGTQAQMNPEITTLNGVRSMGGNDSREICWAISVAMMVNYKKGTAYTGNDIVNQCSDSIYTQIPGYGSPRGTVEWVRAAYTMNKVPISDNAGGLAYGRLYYLLSDNKPVHMDFYGYVNGKLNGHAVVLCGTYWDGNTLVYTFCDPNYADDKVAVLQDKAAYDNAGKVKFVSRTGIELNECTHVYY